MCLKINNKTAATAAAAESERAVCERVREREEGKKYWKKSEQNEGMKIDASDFAFKWNLWES